MVILSPMFIQVPVTGRFGRSGLAINFVDGRRTMEMVKKIEEHFGRKIVKIEIDDPDSIERAVAS